MSYRRRELALFAIVGLLVLGPLVWLAAQPGVTKELCGGNSYIGPWPSPLPEGWVTPRPDGSYPCYVYPTPRSDE